VTVLASTQAFSRSKNAVNARHQKVIALAALGLDMKTLAKEMGSIRVDSVKHLLSRALAAQAETLRAEGAWEQAYTLHITRLDMLMAVWMPRALAGDEKAADKVDKWLTHYERLQGLAAPQKLEAAVIVEDGTDMRATVIAAVLARLDDVGLRQQIIDGTAVDTEAVEA